MSFLELPCVAVAVAVAAAVEHDRDPGLASLASLATLATWTAPSACGLLLAPGRLQIYGSAGASNCCGLGMAWPGVCLLYLLPDAVLYVDDLPTRLQRPDVAFCPTGSLSGPPSLRQRRRQLPIDPLSTYGVRPYHLGICH
jgi:hypothetical protein